VRLIIAEKPSMGRAIATALGIHGGGQGSIEGRREIVTWCVGHLVELAPPEVYDAALERWTLERLPIVPERFALVTTRRTATQFRIVRDLVHRADVTEVVNACDSGREGEAIFDLVYRQAEGKKPVLRLWTASLTEDAIRDAYRRLQPASAYTGLRHAARSRAEADWLIGLNATRAQTLVAQRTGDRGVWSLGRVQTPTLALVVERDLAITRFVAEPYWTLEATLRAQGGRFEARWHRIDGERTIDRFGSAAEAKAAADRARRPPALVRAVEGSEARLAPERLYDLTTLQREANRRFGFSAAKTLELAQALYEEHKVLSYPRTSSRHLTTDVAATLPALLAKLERHADVGPFAREALATGPRDLGRRFVDNEKVEDHHALLPTGRAPSGLGADEARLYDLVVRRLLGAYQADALDARTVVTCTLGGEAFRATGLVEKSAGWRRVDPPAAAPKGADEGEERALPVLRVGEPLTVEALDAKARKTKPPRPYSEAELLAAMEAAGKQLDDEEQRLAMKDSGLGTPATRAAILENLLDREYLLRERKLLRATPKGLALIEGLRVPVLRSPALTGEWEAKLARMARGQYAREQFMAEVRAFTTEMVATLKASEPPRLAAAAPAPAAARGPSTPTRRTPAKAASAPSTPARPAMPVAKACPSCGKPGRVLWSQGKAAWFHRCDPCSRWLAS
jgi:DNA topoisomerase-3